MMRWRICLVLAIGLAACSGGVAVPDVVGEQVDFARGVIRGAGLETLVEEERTTEIEEGVVMSQIPEAGDSLAEGGVVRLVVAIPDALSVEGSFVLFDDFDRKRAGDSCEGEGGYGDIGSLTPVIVETINGDVLARASLGTGVIASGERLVPYLNDNETSFTASEIEGLLSFAGQQACLFTFTLEVTSGSDEGRGYVVKVGRRGELFLSEDELKIENAVALSLGLG